MNGLNIEFSISTFGFGYEIDSDLTEEKLSHEMSGYCPDWSMVGTTFIHFLANSLATISNIRPLKYEIQNIK
jgi:hypothetical protein